MNWIDSRVRSAENRLEKLYRDMLELEIKIKAALQGIKGLYQQPPGTTGAGTTVYFANHLNLAAATGTFPTITPTSTTATVYQVASGVLSSIGTKTVYNFMPDATNNTKRQILGLNADGTFSVIVESCTAG